MTKQWKLRFEPLTIEYFRARSVVDKQTGCWVWSRAKYPNGYGAMRTEGKTRNAHRFSYQVAYGIDVSPGIDVCHRCDNRLCVNPEHLFLGSRQDNMRDCIQKGRFKRLEPLTGEDSPNAKLAVTDVLAIRADARSQRAIARAYGVDKGTIAHIVHRKTWKHV